ncbi:hypothetical protein HPO96_08110 [Kribbella sandramycini]|uniref:Tachylectin n=1 Tax=Kribbella sandramycini TaxID=60450 RepID=A0A7Y4NZI8_9ACTN|nr:hypothetical protein [Kribbella sandramycini]MBB6569971.1 hypothetical protein [Kribbella sandramycini]NOL40205.1 hypothetical protein [Kribbella sandramycini]
MRRTILSVGVAGALAAAGLVVVTSSSGAAVGDVPAGCAAVTSAYKSDGQRLFYRYERNSDQPTKVESIPGDKLPWRPAALTLGGVWGESQDSFHREEFAAHPTDGYVYRIERAAERGDDRVWRMTQHKVTRLAAGFGGTRTLVYAYPYLYRFTAKSLYRYTVVGQEGIPVDPVKMPGTGWGSIKTMIYERTGGTDAQPVDVLLGTTSAGALKEWRFRRGAPGSSIPSSVLRTTGWDTFTSLSTGSCEQHPEGRSLLAIQETGSVSWHFDANAKDSSGTDIKGGSLGALGWTEKAYGE